MSSINLAREPDVEIGGVAISPPARQIISGAARETLEPRVMQVLVALARRRGEVVSRAELMETCWGGRIVGEDVIYRCIAAIRRLAERYGGFRLTTVARVGYRLDDLAGNGPQVGDGEESPPVLRLRRAPLTGRDRELRELQVLLTGVLAGRGGLALISGDPGIGKTRLCDEIGALAARAGARVAKGHCYAAPVGEPFSPLLEIVEELAGKHAPAGVLRAVLGDDARHLLALLPELATDGSESDGPAEPDPEKRRRLTIAAFSSVFEYAARDVPLVLVLDDLHWMDESTGLALRRILRRLPETTILILATYREQASEGSAPFAILLDEIMRGRQATQLSLDALSVADTADLVRALTGREFARIRKVDPDPPREQAGAIFDVTKGSPFFIEEVVEQLAGEDRLLDAEGYIRTDISTAEIGVTQGVRTVIASRIARLSPGARKVLEAAAVVGARVPIDLLNALDLGDESSVLEALGEASRAALVITEPGRYRFVHDLIRQAVLAGIADAQRQRLHYRVIDAIERLYPAQLKDRAAEIAHHFAEAGAAADPDRAAGHLLKAGFAALEAADFEQAVTFFTAGARVAPPQALRVRARLLRGRARGLQHLGRWDAAIESLHEALETYEAIGEPDGIVRIGIEFSEMLTRAERFAEGALICQRVLSKVGEPPAAEKTKLLAALGMNAWKSGDLELGEASLAQATKLADALGEPAVTAPVLYCRAYAHLDLAEEALCLPLALEATRLYQGLDDQWMASTAMGLAAYAHLAVGRWDEAFALALETRSTCERIGNVSAWNACQTTLAQLVGLRRGTFANDHNRGLMRKQGAFEDLGTSDYYRGDWSSAITNFETGLERGAGPIAKWLCWSGLLVVLTRSGERARALSMLDAWNVEDHVINVGLRPRAEERLALLAAAWALWDLGENRYAARLYPVLNRFLEQRVYGMFSGRLLESVVAMTAAAAGLWEQSERHFASVLDHAGRLPNKLEQAETRYSWGQALLRRGAPGEAERAKRLLAEAAERFGQIGLGKHRAMALELANP